MGKFEKKQTSSRKIGLPLAFSAALAGTMLATEKPAHAAVDPVTVGAYIKVAYEAVELFKSIFGSSGDDLNQRLQQIQSSIINEMRTQRNMELKSNANTVFNLFRNLTDNTASDPVNDELWTEILGRQQETADAMFDIMMYANDSQSSYELTPAYNSLLATGTNLLDAKKRIWPNFPSSWNDFYIWMQPGMSANYKLIGSQRHQCYPGQNPGYRPRPASGQALVDWLGITKTGKFKDTLLWRKKLANKNYVVAIATVECAFTGPSEGHPHHCNPVSSICNTVPTEETLNPLLKPICKVVTVPTSPCTASQTPLACAEVLAKAAFDADPAVKLARAGMKGVQTLSGGNDYDWQTNDPLLAQAKFVDPWIEEPSCGSAAPWAYPQQP
jgi:hypothetical protein